MSSPSRISRHHRLMAAMTAFVLVVAACGDDDDTADAVLVPTTPTDSGDDDGDDDGDDSGDDSGDEQPVDADREAEPAPDPEPEPATTAAPAADSSAAALPVTVTYFDWEWEVQEAFVSPHYDDTTDGEDEDPEQDWMHVVVEITNRMTNFGVSGLSHTDSLRLFLPDDDLPIKAAQIWDGDHEDVWNSLGMGSEERKVRQWTFPVPVGTDPATTTIEIGLPDDVEHVLELSNPEPRDQVVALAMSPQTFGGPYSWNAVDFVVLDSFASFNRGFYPDSMEARPGGVDRRANDGHVFVIVELQADQYSTSGVAGVNPGGHYVVLDDGSSHSCSNDAPGLYGAETVVYTASCEVPLGHTGYTFVVDGGKGCDDCTYELEIDPSFAGEFIG